MLGSKLVLAPELDPPREARSESQESLDVELCASSPESMRRLFFARCTAACDSPIQPCERMGSYLVFRIGDRDLSLSRSGSWPPPPLEPGFCRSRFFRQREGA